MSLSTPPQKKAVTVLIPTPPQMLKDRADTAIHVIESAIVFNPLAPPPLPPTNTAIIFSLELSAGFIPEIAKWGVQKELGP